MRIVTVNDYRTGAQLAKLQITQVRMEDYEDHAQWPQGIIRADQVLHSAERETYGIAPNQVVWLENV